MVALWMFYKYFCSSAGKCTVIIENVGKYLPTKIVFNILYEKWYRML